MQKVSISSIKVGFRTRFDNGNIAELAEDIKQHGMLQPIVVAEINECNRMGESVNGRMGVKDLSPVHPLADSPVQDSHSYHFELIAGFRRLKAAESLGWTQIPATIQGSSTKDQVPNTGSEFQSEASSAISALKYFDLQLSENMQRKELNPIELSDAILERKHRFEQVYGKIERGGDHCSEDYQKSKLYNREFAYPDFFEETGKLLKMSKVAIFKFLQLNNIDPDLKEKVSSREINYQAALSEQAERNRQKNKPVKKSAKMGSFRLPNQESIAPFQKQYQTAPNLMQLFMLIQHSCQQVQRMQEKPLEYDKFELEYNYMLVQQMEVVMGYYSEILTQLHQTQENKLKELNPNL